MTAPENSFYQEYDFARREEKLTSSEDYRTPFQIDRDRILYTQAFRRLQAKTQVFQTGAYDFYRTRLTHSLEVAQIGRSLCHYLIHTSEAFTSEFHPDPDLIEAISLTHDIGHPPFGHAGERVLNDLMREFGGFEGNAQSLRLLTELIFENTARFTGINPTRAFLDGILKYKSLWSEMGGQTGKTPAHHFLYDNQLPWREFAHEGQPEATEGYPRSIECQIMDWADDTAYSLNDLADGLRSRLLSPHRVESWLEERTADFKVSDQIHEKLLKAFRKGSLESFCGYKIGEFIRAARIVASNHPWGERSHRYAWNLGVDPAIEEECRLYKRLSFELVFQSEPLQQMEANATQMLRKTFGLLIDNYENLDSGVRVLHLLPAIWESLLHPRGNRAHNARVISDYLASLTDGQALRLYRRIFTPEGENLLDLLA